MSYSAYGSGAGALHNSLVSLQGGTSGEYYHFTATEHTALLQTRRPIDIRDYGAVDGGVTDNHTAISAAIAACTVGGSIFIPTGKWALNTPLIITKEVNFVGEGRSSIIWINVASPNTGISIIPSGGNGYMYGLNWRNFLIAGPATCCGTGLYISKVNNSIFYDIHVNVGTGAAGNSVLIDDGICNHYNFIVSANEAMVGSGVWVNGVSVSTSAGAATVSNANIFDCLIEGGTGKGLYITCAGENGNNEIRGVYEGIAGYGVHLKGCKGAHLHDVHLEGPAGGNELVIENCAHIVIGANVAGFNLTDPDVLLVNSIGTYIDGLRCGGLSIDSNCEDTRIAEFNSNVSGLSDSGKRTSQLFTRARQTNVSLEQVAPISDFSNLLINGSAERWTATNTIPPGSWANMAGSPTWARESSIVKHGTYSAKVTLTNDPKTAGIPLLDAAQTAQLPANAVATVSGWIYVPSTGGDTVVVSLYWDGGGGVSSVNSYAPGNVWTRISFSYYVRGAAADKTYSHLVFSTAAASAICYLDGFSVSPSFVGSAVLFTPNADEFPVYTGTATWNPASIAASGYLAQDFVCPGAALGMLAQAGAGVDVTDLIVSATVTAADTVTIVLFNPTVGAIDLASSTWNVMARRIF